MKFMSGDEKILHKHPYPLIFNLVKVILMIKYVCMPSTEHPYCFQQPSLFPYQIKADLHFPLTIVMVKFLLSQAVYIC